MSSEIQLSTLSLLVITDSVHIPLMRRIMQSIRPEQVACELFTINNIKLPATLVHLSIYHIRFIMRNVYTPEVLSLFQVKVISS